MTVVVHLTVPAREFTLGRLLGIDPAMRFELERVVPTSGRIVPFFWAIGGDLSTFERDLAEREGVESLEVCDTATDREGTPRALFEVAWNPAKEDFMHNVVNARATILEAIGTNDTWKFEIRFMDQSDVTAFQDACKRAEVGFRVDRVYTLDEWHVRTSYQLTEKQQELLLTAIEEGYFDVPRNTSLDELAVHFDVSRQALSERLRRAHATLIRNALAAEADDL